MDFSSNLNAYWLLLKDLNANEKLSLIELLVKSLQKTAASAVKNNQKTETPTTDHWVFQFSGSWKDFPETAENLIAIMEGSRTLGRQTEML